MLFYHSTQISHKLQEHVFIPEVLKNKMMGCCRSFTNNSKLQAKTTDCLLVRSARFHAEVAMCIDSVMLMKYVQTFKNKYE